MPTALASPHATPLTKRQNRAPKGEINYYEGGRRLMVARARHEELKVRKLESTLVEREAVKKLWFAVARQVRDGLENLPSRLAGLVAPETSQEKCYALIQKEIREVLEALTT